MSKQSDEFVIVGILLVMTGVTGMIDAVSFLTLGHVFTANMTGNVVFLGFALAGAPGISLTRSVLALLLFMLGAVIGGRMTRNADMRRTGIRALTAESALLSVAAGFAITGGGPAWLDSIVAFTALAMGLRNAVVRKLGIPDLTTTVLTLTITGFAADSALAGGINSNWHRRIGAIVAMLAGAAAGTMLLRHSVALPLLVAAVVSGVCAFTRFHFIADGE